MPSSFNTVLSSASVSSTSPPVSVSGTVYIGGAVSRTRLRSRPNPVRGDTLSLSSRSGRLGNVNPIPIGYGFRPRLRGPANPARINLAQEPLDFRREGFSPSLTLLMSAFALPIPPANLTVHLHRPTERSATTPESRCQKSDIRTAAMQGREHTGNLPALAPPALRRRLVDIAEVPAIKRPYLHLVRRTDRHHHEPAELRFGQALAAKALRQVGADRFDARRTWSASANCSIRGNSRLARCTSNEIS